MNHRRSLALALLFAAAPPAEGANLEVPKDYATIQAAVDAAGPGDVVRIAKGDYAEAVVIDGKTDLTIRGKGKKTRLGGSTIPITVENSSDITIDALHFSGETAGIYVIDMAGIAVRNCRAEGDYGIWALHASQMTIEGCSFEAGSTDVHLAGSTECVIRDCQLAGSTGLVIASTSTIATVVDNEFSNSLRGVVVRGASSVLDNEFDSCPLGVHFFNEGTGATVAGNSFKGCETAILSDDDADSAVLDDNVIKGGGVGLDLDPGMNFTILRNSIKKTASDAIRLRASATGCLVAKNKIVKAGASGIHVEGVGNTLMNNSAKKSAGFDLTDETNAGDNSYVANKFTKIAP